MYLLTLLSLSCPRGESECILSYSQYIKVRKDGSMLVREDIKVVASGDKIKRGIYRDFPTKYLGGKYVVKFEVKRILRDGRRESYFTRETWDGVRVYIGKKDVYLRPGVYTYTIEYETDRQLGFFEEHDELYWNVTGNRWMFRMYEVKAVVELPKGVPKDKIRLKAYTGKYGSRGQSYRAWVDGRGRAHFKTTRVLEPREGLTIVVGWPKGYVKVPKSVEDLIRNSCPGGEKACIREHRQRIKVKKDGSLYVREEMKVVGDVYRGNDGVIREFPVSVKGRFGFERKVRLKVKKVLINGKRVRWEVEELKDWKYNLRVMNPPSNPGVHTLSVDYEIMGLIRPSGDRDVLEWEAVSDGLYTTYNFQVSVDLPRGVPKSKIRANAESYKVKFKKLKDDKWGDVAFASLSPIESDVNLFISWPKGYVSSSFWGSLMDYGKALIPWSVVILLALFYAAAWFLVGRDPKKGVITPLFHPPKGMSPAAIRYLYKMDYDAQCLAANIISAAVKGAVRIKEEDGRYELEGGDEDVDLTQDEEIVVKNLKGKDLGSYAYVNPTSTKLKKHLRNTLGKLFKKNYALVYLGAALSYIAVLLLAFFPLGLRKYLLAAGLAFLFIGVVFVIILLLSSYISTLLVTIFNLKEKYMPILSLGITLTLFSAAFIFMRFGFLLKAMTNFYILNLTLVFFAIFLLFLWARRYMPQFSKRAMDIITQIEGFKHFLLTAEKDRLEKLFPKDSLPKIYERYLPYALSLDVADTWADRFASYLESIGYEPTWYVSSSTSTLRTPVRTYKRVYNDLSSRISSALEPPSNRGSWTRPSGGSSAPSGGGSSPPPGSTSGFGEGGYSGGGGGGGGGGGW